MSAFASPASSTRTHTVPTHLNLPDQVLTVWSFNLTARQLLLLLVGGGLSGDLWHLLARLGSVLVVGQGIRLALTLLPLLCTLILAWYQHAGRYLEVWCIVLVRYVLRPHRLVWRTVRFTVPPLPCSDALPADRPRRRHGGRAGTRTRTRLATAAVPDHVAEQEVA